MYVVCTIRDRACYYYMHGLCLVWSVDCGSGTVVQCTIYQSICRLTPAGVRLSTGPGPGHLVNVIL